MEVRGLIASPLPFLLLIREGFLLIKSRFFGGKGEVLSKNPKIAVYILTIILRQKQFDR